MMTASQEKPQGKSSRTIARASRLVVGSYQDKEAEELQLQLGRYIRMRRERKLLSQLSFGTKIGVGENTVARWERGYQVSLPHLVLLARFLKMKPWELLHHASVYGKDKSNAT
jgi:DNA-binding transcriptional regulator YiaG